MHKSHTETVCRKGATRGRPCPLFSCKSPTVFTGPLQSKTQVLLSNPSMLFLPSPGVKPSMYPLNFYPLMYLPISSQHQPPLAPHNPGLLQHSNSDPRTGALSSSVLLFHTTAASLRKGPSPTTIHFPFPTPYLSCNHLSA